MSNSSKYKMDFYTIDSCGYYKRGGEIPVFCGTRETFSNLKKFFDKNIANISRIDLYSPSGQAPSFPIAIHEGDDKSFLFVFWNPTTDSSGNVLFLDSTKLGSKGVITKEQASTKQTPGFPSYFWVPSGVELVVVLSSDGWRKKKGPFDLYCRNFLQKANVDHCHSESSPIQDNEETGRSDVVANHDLYYARKKGHEEESKIYVKFKTSRARKKPEIVELKKRLHEINRVILVSKVVKRIDEARNGIGGFFGWMVEERKAKKDEKRTNYFRTEIDYYPTKKSFISLLKLAEGLSDDERLGVKLKANKDDDDSAIKWLDEVVVDFRVKLDVKQNKHGYPEPSSLLKALDSNEKIKQHLVQIYSEESGESQRQNDEEE